MVQSTCHEMGMSRLRIPDQSFEYFINLASIKEIAVTSSVGVRYQGRSEGLVVRRMLLTTRLEATYVRLLDRLLVRQHFQPHASREGDRSPKLENGN
jgi:hypothetical protein